MLPRSFFLVAVVALILSAATSADAWLTGHHLLPLSPFLSPLPRTNPWSFFPSPLPSSPSFLCRHQPQERATISLREQPRPPTPPHPPLEQQQQQQQQQPEPTPGQLRPDAAALYARYRKDVAGGVTTSSFAQWLTSHFGGSRVPPAPHDAGNSARRFATKRRLDTPPQPVDHDTVDDRWQAGGIWVGEREDASPPSSPPPPRHLEEARELLRALGGDPDA